MTKKKSHLEFLSKNKETNRRNKMTKTIQIANHYQTLDRIIKTFNEPFLNYALIPVFLGAFVLSLMLLIDFKSDYIDNSLSTFFYGFSIFFLTITTLAAFLTCIVVIVLKKFGYNKQYFVTSYKRYYQNEFTDAEKSIIEHILNDKFDNIIQTNRKVISKKLNDVKESMENEILNQEYLEAFKKDIEENLKERKQYIPLLLLFVKEHHARDNENVMMERANQYLSKAGLSTFKTKEKPNFEIVEETS